MGIKRTITSQMKKASISIVSSLLLILIMGVAKGQAPTISAIDYRNNYPGEVMIISGLNYSSDPSQMKVLFGGVEGNVIASDGTSLEVEIPGNAGTDNIHVINTANGLSVFSANKFYPTHHGTGFNVDDLQDPVQLTSVGEQFDVCACDLDGDGKRDLVATKFSNEVNLAVYRNITTDPTNIQYEVTNVNVSVTSRNITCSDLNGDGKAEILFGRNDTGNRNFVYVLTNNSTLGSISFGSSTTLQLATGDNAIRMLVNDLDFDGKPDVMVTNSSKNEISIFRNTSAGSSISFSTSPIHIEVDGAATTAGVEMQDLDGDAKPEIITTQFSGANIYVLRNTSGVGNIAFQDALEYPLDKSIRNVKIGDLDSDGKPDIAVTHTIENSMSVVLNKSTTGNLNFQDGGNFVTNTEPWGIDMADMDGDSDLDIVVSNNGFNTINIFVNNTEPTANSLNFSTATINLPTRTRNMILKDVNNDAKPDIIYTSA